MYHGVLLEGDGKQFCNNGNGIINTPTLHPYKNIILIHLKLGFYVITAGTDIIGTCQVHVGMYKLTQSRYSWLIIHMWLLSEQNQHSLHTNWNSFYCPTLNNYIHMFTVTTSFRQLVCFFRLHFADHVNSWLLKWCQWRHRFITPRYDIRSERHVP